MVDLIRDEQLDDYAEFEKLVKDEMNIISKGI